MKEPALKHPSIPGVVMRVVPFRKPINRFAMPRGVFKEATSAVVVATRGDRSTLGGYATCSCYNLAYH